MITEQTLRALAEATSGGVAFVLAYGVTWTACGVVWRRWGAGAGSLVTLLQGSVAFPVAMVLSWASGDLDQRPDEPLLDELVALMGGAQLLAIPFLIALHRRAQFALVPHAFATVTAVHFVPYAWLYRTWIYVVLGIAIAAVTTAISSVNTQRRAGATCFATGGILLIAVPVLLAGT